jgi:salicylate hydroxylase
MSQKQILIIGAGIGGLTAANALVRHGFSVRVFEQAPELREVGAGLTLSSGALRCMEVLGLEERVRGVSTERADVAFRHWRTGEVLRSGFDPKPRIAAARHARQVHRADLQALLATALREESPDAIELGWRLERFEQDGAAVTALFADGRRVLGDLLIACDGVRSVARDAICGPQRLTFTGQVAYRCLVPMERALEVLPHGCGSVFIGPGRTINRYPLRHGAIMNCVGLAQTELWEEEGWNTPASNAEFLAQFEGWHPEVTGLIAAAPPAGIIKWGLFAREPLPRWSAGRAVLLGDAAHPMLPFLGQGAVMAIEDGVVLARSLVAYSDFERSLASYEAARKPRTTLVYEASNYQGRLTQGDDPENYGKVASPAHDSAIFDFDPFEVPV